MVLAATSSRLSDIPPLVIPTTHTRTGDTYIPHAKLRALAMAWVTYESHAAFALSFLNSLACNMGAGSVWGISSVPVWGSALWWIRSLRRSALYAVSSASA